MTLEILRAAAKIGPAEAASGFESGILRFSLEYAAPADVGTERARLVALLGGVGFGLRPLPSGEDPEILILEFPGVARQQSSAALFREANALTEALGLVSCTPDVAPGWINGDEVHHDAPESIGGVVKMFCESQAKPPAKKRWAISNVRADRAWQRFNAFGEGILVGQPDTGVAEHRELDEGLALGLGLNVLTGHGPPIDPLTAKLGNPGHGTATSSCVISRDGGDIIGVAPAARVVPLRCVDAVVLTGGAAVAAAIDHARKQGCHVITMSLGGPVEFPDLRRAIQRAVDANMIVLAAAGNCVGLVVYPAWDRNVIAVAGIDERDKRWKGSSHGAKIDIAAPGENVYVASRKSPADTNLSVVNNGQGTSFAVAMTAGCAALWLSHHGVAAVAAAAAAKGVSVQELFRAAVRQSARRVDKWPKGMGPGVIDAEALLALDLNQIQVGAATESAHPYRASLGPDFEWDRYGAEAGYLALDRAQRRDPQRIEALESPVAPRPSPELAAAVRAVGKSPVAVFGAPPALVLPRTAPMAPGPALRALARATPGNTESASRMSNLEARAALEGAGARVMLEAASATMESLIETHDNPRNKNLLKALIGAAPAAVRGLVGGSSMQNLDGKSQVAVEALILLTGRPALRVLDSGYIAGDDPMLGDWGGDLWGPRNVLTPIIDAVGRIDLRQDGRNVHIGTGTLVAPGVVLTNRHVLDAIAEPLPSAGGQSFLMSPGVSIIFDPAAANATRRYEITGVLAAGPDRIGMQADVGKLDAAFLLMSQTNAAGLPPPKPVSYDDLPSENGPRLLVVGYPGRPSSAAATNPNTNKVDPAIWDRLWEIFQNRYGVKYISPGEVGRRPGELAGDTARWGFSHDATTLAGHSGSAIINLETLSACGLHFGGAPLRQNMAHGLTATRAAASQAGLIDPAVFGLMTWK